MSLEAGTPQQHRQLWEATFDTPSYVANFKEERGDRNVVHWKSVHSDQKVRKFSIWRKTLSRGKLTRWPNPDLVEDRPDVVQILHRFQVR